MARVGRPLKQQPRRPGFAGDLRRYMERKDLSQEGLAAICKVSFMTVHRWLEGRTVSIGNEYRVRDILGLRKGSN